MLTMLNVVPGSIRLSTENVFPRSVETIRTSRLIGSLRNTIRRVGLSFSQSSPKGTSSNRMWKAPSLVIVKGKQLPIGRMFGYLRSAATIVR